MTTPCGLPGTCKCKTSYSKSRELQGCRPAQFWHGVNVLKNLSIRSVKRHECFDDFPLHHKDDGLGINPTEVNDEKGVTEELELHEIQLADKMFTTCEEALRKLSS